MFLKLLNIYLTILLGLVAVIGDYLVAHSNLHLFQAIFDNATHAVIGGLTWFFYRHNYKNYLAIDTIKEIALCTLLSSCIDLDHFIAAHSIHLKVRKSMVFCMNI